MASFQVNLGRNGWQDYEQSEDKILKRAFMAGFPSAKFHLRGQEYHYDFKKMTQINKHSGKEREIRAPMRKNKHGKEQPWTAPSKPLVAPGNTTVVNVPPGSPGTTIQVPYPGMPGKYIAVNVPATAKAGQAMLVPVPPPESVISPPPGTSPAPSGGGMSTGGKILTGGAVLVGVGGAAVGGAILGEHIAEHGIDATVDAVGDGLEDLGEGIGDFAVDAGEFLVDAGEDVGDFIMDLF